MLFNYTPSTTLYVAVNANGDIVNDNDIRHLGPAFSYNDIKVGVDFQYALHIDSDCTKQGAFYITDCKLLNVVTLAKAYCKQHSIEVVSKSYIEHSYYRNTYEVVDKNGIEYHFHISRAYEENDRRVDWEFVYVSVKQLDGTIAMSGNITNINKL